MGYENLLMKGEVLQYFLGRPINIDSWDESTPNLGGSVVVWKKMIHDSRDLKHVGGTCEARKRFWIPSLQPIQSIQTIPSSLPAVGAPKIFVCFLLICGFTRCLSGFAQFFLTQFESAWSSWWKCDPGLHTSKKNICRPALEPGSQGPIDSPRLDMGRGWNSQLLVSHYLD